MTVATKPVKDEARADADKRYFDELPLHQFLTYRMARVQTKLNGQATRLLQRVSGLSLTQWRIIALVGSQPGARSTDLTRDAAFDKGMFSRKLKTLVAAGHIISETDPTDHRVHLLRLSPTGQEIFENTLPRMRERQRMLHDVLSDEEASNFLAALEKLEAAAEILPGDQ